MNLSIFSLPDPSGRMSKQSFLLKNYPDEYDYIITYCVDNNIEVPFKEKVYLAINRVNIPVCKNCNNNVKFKNFTIGYLKYCSNKCVSSNIDIKRIKEEKSLLKYGTKTPAESKIIKDKIIKTNQDRYGYNSPMCSLDIQEKSKKTLLDNYGVDNPNKLPELLKKRIESFKKSNYRESYKKASLEKYGVDHPWKNKEIHNKTINHFYSDYRERINSKINKNDFSFIKFEKEIITTNLLFNCNKCGNDFKILPFQFYYRVNNKLNICTNCFPISQNASIVQIEMYNFIVENYSGEVLTDYKDAISPYEIDIYLPELNLGFEFNGLWWHSSKFKNENYHFHKKEISKNNNISLYTIWEDDWNIKRDICKSYILNKINKSNKIMARKCKVIEVDYNTSKSFLNNNHLQGDCKSSIRLGLYYKDELMSLMTFSKLRLPMGGRNKEGVYELTRFCNKIFNSVIGGSSKLLKYFLINYRPIEIETYSDNLISDGNMYQKLGFNYIHTSKPGYWYVVNEKREHRFNWRKQRLKSLGYDMNKTESEIMSELGFYKIYNAGNKKWIYSTKN